MGRRFYYNVAVEPGLKDDVAAFSRAVATILTRRGGWERWGFAFVPVYPDDAGATAMRRRLSQYMTLQLCSNATIAQFGADFDGMSVADCSQNFIRINVDRWHAGAKPAGAAMALPEYRQYVVLHEVGQILSRCSPSTPL